MKASDLQINDLLYADGALAQVTSLGVLGGDVVGILHPCSSIEKIYADNTVALSRGARNIKHLEPIPITEKLLEIAGITEEQYSFYDGYNFEFHNKSMCVSQGPVWCVHELQHILRACGLNEKSEELLFYVLQSNTSGDS